ncbi:HAD family hydrolase [[Phormidium ambiguum] IAM M-71]|uniref:HAD family hydrolase n=1 Tax=[Phormidium ambiguum] IAM M-71 TaxID=454136 RepID=A0A1U7IF74_9CYAN|nr:HAD family phosphatase [Phormidium ambiguum]OKH35572.1 HAD family hydrolase [Phormidium ambiguum IAM M-71]
MGLKAVLFDFNGIIINDEPIHEQLIEQILIAENLRPKRGEFRQICLGRSDRVCLKELFSRRGRVLTEGYLNQLISRKAQAYQERIAEMPELPIYPGLEDFILKLRTANLKIGVVTGALRSEVQLVLNRANLVKYFSVITSGDDLTVSKPEPDGYLLAIEQLNQEFKNLNLQASECLAIEDSPAGITAAKRAGMQVLGVANTYPFHIIQRQANWTVDYFRDLELERLQQVFSGEKFQSTVT